LEVTGRRPDCSRRTSDVATLIVLNFAHANATSAAGQEGQGKVRVVAAVAEEVDRLLTPPRLYFHRCRGWNNEYPGKQWHGPTRTRTDGFSCLVGKILSSRWYRVVLGSLGSGSSKRPTTKRRIYEEAPLRSAWDSSP